VIEDIDGQGPFFASAWLARGGVDLINPECHEGHCEFISFGYNRAALDIPVSAIDLTQPAVQSILFPGLSQSERTSSGDEETQTDLPPCEMHSLQGSLCIPDVDRETNPGVAGRPNGAAAAAVVVNIGRAEVWARLRFIRGDSESITTEGKPFVLPAGHQSILAAPDHLGSDLGEGTLELEVLEGDSQLVGIGVQSDRYSQFLGYSVPGMVIAKSPLTPQSAGSASDFVVPYVVCAGGSQGFDSQLNLFNQGTTATLATVSYLDSLGTEVAYDSVALGPREAFSSTLSQLAVPEGFQGWMRIQAPEPVTVSAQVARGGFDTTRFGWQSFSFRVPEVALENLGRSSKILFLATNESRGNAETPPPVSPYEKEDIQHVNGFDIGVFVVNLDDKPISFRLAFKRRYVSREIDQLEVSLQVHTLLPGESMGLVAGRDLIHIKPGTLDDGMLIVEILDSRTHQASSAYVAAAAVQSDRGFKYFSYAVPGHYLP
jgi:hypothetical protein